MTIREELRTFVAEKVMGWEDDVPCGYSCKWRWKSDTGRWRYQAKYDFCPLESWADAGRVIDRMEELGWIWTMNKYENGWVDVLFKQKDGSHYPHGYVSSEDGETREAISLAALRALGVEVE